LFESIARNSHYDGRSELDGIARSKPICQCLSFSP
jgi:hypothetical protein